MEDCQKKDYDLPNNSQRKFGFFYETCSPEVRIQLNEKLHAEANKAAQETDEMRKKAYLNIQALRDNGYRSVN
jgi:hypothetical protein